MMTRTLQSASSARLATKVMLPEFTLMMSPCMTTTRAVRILQTASSRSLIDKMFDLVEPGRTLAHDAVESTARGDKMCPMPSVVYVARKAEYFFLSRKFILVTYLNALLREVC